ncbi:Iron-binding protein iscA [Candidatus Johnevansia muelleri]|uniref:Iron-binding protein iscA n=1 Tax=Candidatus Johnevansia muelleri TaxID=1495769 RepID=A0A078KEJ0_9GAMM|nr:Iron-binding protein iscA [Candidatus Evansia muelleri]
MPNIFITSYAVNHINCAIKNRGTGIGIRISIKPSGCSGYSYNIDFADYINKYDYIFEQYGAKIIVDYNIIGILDFTELDYVIKGITHSFKFNNPNIKDECGCGESFSI